MASDNSEPEGRLMFDCILVVEDNAVIAMNTEALLEELGAQQVEVAASVSAAMDLIGIHPFDLAILDLNLGSETSLPIAERLQRNGVSIIFSTGYGDHVQLPAAFGSVPVLKKPYTFSDLQELMLNA